MNAALYLFHIDSFSYTPLPYRLTPSPWNPPGKTDPNEVTCTKKERERRKKKHKKTEKYQKLKSPKKKSSKFKRSVGGRGGGGEPGYDQVSLEKTSEKTMTGRGEDDDTFLFVFGGKFLFLFKVFCFCLGRHGDMLGKRWANRHGGWVVLKGGKKKQGRGES